MSSGWLDLRRANRLDAVPWRLSLPTTRCLAQRPALAGGVRRRRLRFWLYRCSFAGLGDVLVAVIILQRCLLDRVMCSVASKIELDRVFFSVSLNLPSKSKLCLKILISHPPTCVCEGAHRSLCASQPSSVTFVDVCAVTERFGDCQHVLRKQCWSA